MIKIITKINVLKNSSEAIISEYVISLDSKSRLVLPLEIRDILGLDKNNRKLLLKIIMQGKTILLEIEKSQINSDLTTCSKNCSYLQSGDFI